MSAAERARGARAEVAVVNYLRANGYPDARRYLAGDGRQPGDIDGVHGWSIESKDVKSSAWPTWCAQAAGACPDGQSWVVVRRLRGTPDVGQWPCVLEAVACPRRLGGVWVPPWEQIGAAVTRLLGAERVLPAMALADLGEGLVACRFGDLIAAIGGGA